VLVVNKEGNLQARPLLSAPLPADARNPERALFLSDRDATVAAIMHPCVLVPEGKTDASWLRLLGRIADAGDDGILMNEANAFTHEVGVIPTKDARIVEVFGYLAKCHPRVLCLVDSDVAGQGYLAALCALRLPPRAVIRWPQDWRIEDLIGWIVTPNSELLREEEVVAAGVPDTVATFVDALLGPLKTNEVVHALLADAIANSTRARARVQHVLKVLALIAAGRPVNDAWAVAEDHANGVTKIWTFLDAVPGL